MHAINSSLPTASVATLQPGTRVLFANVPADGHFNPLTGLAVYLKDKGCDVRWYTSVTYAEKIKKMALPFYPLKKALDVSASNLDEVFKGREKIKTQVGKLVFDMINAFILRAPEYFEDIKEIRKEFAFDVMICDITFGAIPFVKEKLNVPVISICIFPLCETSRDLPPAGLGLTPSSSFWCRKKQDLLRFVADKVLFAKPSKVLNRLLMEQGIDPGKSNVFDILIKKSTLVLQSGTPGFEYNRTDLGKNIRFIGPLHPYKSNTDTKRWFDERLNRYEKVVLVTQGTVEKDVEKIITPTLEAFEDTKILVVATTGGSQTTELQNRFPQPNIIVEDFIPFDDIMPYADVYVTNGGYGGVMLGIQHGLPLVVAGVHEGKNEINARVGYFELGVNLGTEKPTPQQVKASVEKVFNEPRFKKNVESLLDEFYLYNPNELCAQYVAQVVGKGKSRPSVKRQVHEV